MKGICGNELKIKCLLHGALEVEIPFNQMATQAKN